MAELIYNFGNGEEFAYEYNESDAVDYIVRTLGYDEILKDYAQYIFPKETQQNKKIISEYGFTDQDSISSMDEEEKEDLVNEIIDKLLDADVYNNELYEYFYDDAYEEYKEYEDYNDDPYSYYGLRRSDF